MLAPKKIGKPVWRKYLHSDDSGAHFYDLRIEVGADVLSLARVEKYYDRWNVTNLCAYHPHGVNDEGYKNATAARRAAEDILKRILGRLEEL